MSLLSYSGVGGILQVLEAHPDSSASSPFCKHLSFSLLVKSVAWPLSPTRLEMRPCPSLRTERRVLGGRAGFPLLINFSGLDKSVPEPRVEWYLLWLLSDSFFREEMNTNPFWYQISLDGTTLLTPGRTGAGARLGVIFLPLPLPWTFLISTPTLLCWHGCGCPAGSGRSCLCSGPFAVPTNSEM